MKNKLLLSLAFATLELLPLTAQQDAPPPTVDRQNSTSTPDQNTPASNSAPAQTPDRQNTAPDQNTGNQNTGSQSTGNNAAGQSNAQIPTYRVTVVQRTTQAADYRDRGGT